MRVRSYISYKITPIAKSSLERASTLSENRKHALSSLHLQLWKVFDYPQTRFHFRFVLSIPVARDAGLLCSSFFLVVANLLWIRFPILSYLSRSKLLDFISKLFVEIYTKLDNAAAFHGFEKEPLTAWQTIVGWELDERSPMKVKRLASRCCDVITVLSLKCNQCTYFFSLLSYFRRRKLRFEVRWNEGNPLAMNRKERIIGRLVILGWVFQRSTFSVSFKCFSDNCKCEGWGTNISSDVIGFYCRFAFSCSESQVAIQISYSSEHNWRS